MLIGAAVGYVLGAKAGRERYDQIVRAWHRLTESPTVRKAAGTAKDKAFEAAHIAKEKSVEAAHVAKEKAPWTKEKTTTWSNGQPVT
ncbi:YtxH domain-containing protein [Lentzea sp. NPDC042327]|uniref:YtxH domain-containing protein n=1 Tax=Lentzea sp. NPDC042327 TaxID=3154801 RepID=UPI0033E6A119